jgi:peptide/nickel transport system permease protein
MLAYVIRRLITAVFLAYVVATLIFLAVHLLPGNPAEVLLSGSGGSSPSQASIEALSRNLGLDEPLWVQYKNYLGNLLQGDLGRSYQDGRPVSQDVQQRLPRTLELLAAAGVIAVVFGIPLGIVAALNRGGIVDAVTTGMASLGVSIPVFVVGTVLIYFFALQLGWLPAGGYVSFSQNPLQHLQYLILPAISIGVELAAVVARMARSATLDVLGQDWVRTARSKGLPRRKILARHVVRNSLNPVVTVIGLRLGSLLGGTVLIEFVFNWPGLSSLLVEAANQRDYLVVQGVVLVISILFILLNLLIDLTYSLLDPRVAHD